MFFEHSLYCSGVHNITWRGIHDVHHRKRKHRPCKAQNKLYRATEPNIHIITFTRDRLRSIGSETWWCWCGICINVVNLLWLQPSLHKPKSMFWTASKTSKIQMPCTEKTREGAWQGPVSHITWNWTLGIKNEAQQTCCRAHIIARFAAQHSLDGCVMWYVSPVTNHTSNFVSFAIHFKVCSKLRWCQTDFLNRSSVSNCTS
jgi:hypothetical protein